MTSPTRAGYEVSGHRVRHLTVSWVQPQASCASASTSASFLIEASDSHHDRGLGVGTTSTCKDGRASSLAFFTLINGHHWVQPGRVRPGDLLTASITFGSHRTALRVTDKKRGWGAKGVAQRAFRFDTAEVITEARSSKSGVASLTNFGTVRFVHAQVNERPLSRLHPRRLTMIGPGGRVKATAGAWDRSGSFSVTWRHR